MTRSKKVLLIVFLVLAVVAIAAAVTYHVIRRPARSVSLLPEGNIMAYVSFKPFHYFNMGDRPFTSDPKYQEFVDQTGFHYEHDLDNIAFSGRGAGAFNGDVSIIVTGSFDKDRLIKYVRQQPGVGTEPHGGRTIFSVRQNYQLLRVCILDKRTVAITAGYSPESMYSIIEKANGSAALPSLLDDYYADVPFASVAWAIVRIPDTPAGQGPGGFSLDYLRNSVAVVSVRYTGSVRVRGEFISDSQANAAKIFQSMNNLLAFGKAAEKVGNTPDRNMSAIVDNTQIQQNGNRVVVNLVVPQEVIQKISEKR